MDTEFLDSAVTLKRRSRYRHKHLHSGPIVKRIRYPGEHDGRAAEGLVRGQDQGSEGQRAQTVSRDQTENSSVRAHAASTEHHVELNEANQNLLIRDGAHSGDEPQQESQAASIPPVGDPDPLITASTCITWTWIELWALVMINGSRKMTRIQFQSIRTLMENMTEQVLEFAMNSPSPALVSRTQYQVSRMPHYSTLLRVHRPILFSTLTVRLTSCFVPVNLRSAGAVSNTTGEGGSPQTILGVVLPTEYARADLACPATYRAMYASSWESRCEGNLAQPRRSTSHEFCIDLWPIVRARDWFYGDSQAFSLHKDAHGSQRAYAENGDVICVTLGGVNQLSSSISSFFHTVAESAADYVLLYATVCVSWTVSHPSVCTHPSIHEASFDHISQRDLEIVARHSSSEYISPTDSFTKTREREAAWRAWRKPLLKPGDFVVLLRPVTPEVDIGENAHNYEWVATELQRRSSSIRLALVFRYWKENMERDTHLLAISEEEGEPFAPVSHVTSPISYSKMYLNVNRVHLVHSKKISRGPQAKSAISSFGTLASGEPYFIYRVLLYWDGFQVQTGKRASGEGLYMLPLNIPPSARNSPNAIRVVAVAPPGVSTDALLENVMDDIVTGATVGVQDYDAKGIRRRVFLDVVGFIGDTPALNSCLDTFGHSGNSFCHQCRTVKSSSALMGPRMAATDCIGTNPAGRRTIKRHAAIRASSAGKDTCALLGIHHSPTPKQSILERLSHRLKSSSASPVLNELGFNIVPRELDPYRACLIAPDHALTGHLRDALNLFFQMLPSKTMRLRVEAFMIQFLLEAGLEAQNRILHDDKTRMHTMGMSQMYSVATIAPFAFSAAYPLLTDTHDSPSVLQETLSACADIIQSAAIIAATLFYRPLPGRDTSEALKLAYENDGEQYIAHVRSLVDTHFDLIKRLCSMPNRDAARLETRLENPQQRHRLKERRKICEIAIKHLDKPNLHRIRELTDATLCMTGSAFYIGELILEKRHQSLKRAIHLSNNKEIHHHALQCAVFNDWQGRLSVMMPEAQTKCIHALRACFRLLYGRDAISAHEGTPPPSQLDSVYCTLTSSQCLAAELKAQAMSVLSLHSISSADEVCEFKHSADDMVPIDPYASLFNAAFPGGGYQFRAFSKISIMVPSSLTKKTVSRNSIIRTVSLSAVPPVDSTRIVQQVPTIVAETIPTPDCCDYFWCTTAVLKVNTDEFNSIFYAVVLPVSTSTISTSPRNDTPCRVVNLTARLSLLKLCRATEIAAKIHKCDLYNCQPDATSPGVCHEPGTDALDGGIFFALCRSSGYPPRSG